MEDQKKRPAGMRVIELEHGDVPFEIILARLYEEERSQARVAKRLGMDQTQLRRYEEALGLEKTTTLRTRDGEVLVRLIRSVPRRKGECGWKPVPILKAR
jgi:hypothetical protein